MKEPCGRSKKKQKKYGGIKENAYICLRIECDSLFISFFIAYILDPISRSDLFELIRHPSCNDSVFARIVFVTHKSQVSVYFQVKLFFR